MYGIESRKERRFTGEQQSNLRPGVTKMKRIAFYNHVYPLLVYVQAIICQNGSALLNVERRTIFLSEILLHITSSKKGIFD